jgi:hypothetical protein
LIGSYSAEHHALYFGFDSGPDGGLVMEVINLIYNQNVTSFVAPSTLLSFMRRTVSNNVNGLLAYAYSNPLSIDVALARAAWCLGRFEYNVIKHNCENFVNWVLTNEDSNTTCSTVRKRAKTVAARQLGLSAGRKKNVC